MNTRTALLERPPQRPAEDLGAAKPAATRLQEARRWLVVRWRWLRQRFAIGVRQLSHGLSHWDIMKEVEAEGRLTGRYLFMVVMSSAIATLGLLLSSPAVVIGAMLISPLMGPIMLLGFSLCALDYSAMRRALFSIGGGVIGALAIAILIVMVSPLREATSEILARTRPNLFDLLVAVFSGLAGGYAVILRKGGAIVGVAIATALMPPLAVVGFGIATGSAVIAGGALFLFMTNLLAIALSVTALAWLHGFASVHSEKTAWWQTTLVLVVFAALSLPLGFALRDIAYEARVQNLVRAEALRPFQGLEAEVSGLKVSFPRNKPIQVHQTVITHARVPGAEVQLEQHYEAALKAPVELRLNQILVDENQPIDAEAVLRMAEQSMAPLQRQIADLDRQDRSADAIRASVPFKTVAVDIDPIARRAVIVAAPGQALTIAAFQDMETELMQRHSNWRVSIIPPMQDLPPVMFESGGTDISDEGAAALDLITWALERWNVTSVAIEGNASLGGDDTFNRRLALGRAEAVGARIQASGIAVRSSSAYGASDQAARERDLGKARFQTAVVHPRF